MGSTNMWNDPWLSKAACVVLILPLAVLPVRAENDALKRGYAIANEKCAHCHAISHDDIPPHAIVIPFRQLFTRFPIPMLVEAQEGGSAGALAAPSNMSAQSAAIRREVPWHLIADGLR